MAAVLRSALAPVATAPVYNRRGCRSDEGWRDCEGLLVNPRHTQAIRVCSFAAGRVESKEQRMFCSQHLGLVRPRPPHLTTAGQVTVWDFEPV